MLLDPRDVGKAIARLRGRRTQLEVSEQGGLSPSQWSLHEGGKRLPGEETLKKILLGLGCSEEILYEETLKARAHRLRGEEGKGVAGKLPGGGFPEEARGGHDLQPLLTELRSMRAHLTMLATYFVGLERRIEQLLGEPVRPS